MFALVACRRGEVGVSVVAEDGSTLLAPEDVVSAGETSLIAHFGQLTCPAGRLVDRQKRSQGDGVGV